MERWAWILRRTLRLVRAFLPKCWIPCLIFALYSLKRTFITVLDPSSDEKPFRQSPRFKTNYHAKAISKLGVIASSPKDDAAAGPIDTIRFGSRERRTFGSAERGTFGYAVVDSFIDAFGFSFTRAKQQSFDVSTNGNLGAYY